MLHNLPTNITPFVGRQKEVDQIGALLRDPDCRLITILGPGGIGKTRLAIEVTNCVAERFADGVAYADLQSLTSALYLPETIAESIALQLVGEETTEQLIGFLADKELLLLLDNFEQLLEGVELVSRILGAAPAVRCVITSREVLNLQEEWLYPLRGLRVPGDVVTSDTAIQASDAVQLYAQRARRVRHDFDMGEDREAVVRICQLVEGMPLAIELAASWSRTMGAGTIAQEIEEGLEFLATGMRNVPDRHRSMNAAMEQSWRRLNEQDRLVFVQLSVFRGGFRRRQAEYVTGATLSLLANLVDRSLLRWEPDGRYSMHELIRQFGAERLTEMPDTEALALERHAEAYAEFLHERSETMFGQRQHEILEEIRLELANVRSALQWAMNHAGLKTLDNLVFVYYQYCDWRGHYRENTEVMDRLVQRLKAMKQTRAVRQSTAACHAYLGWCYIRLGQLTLSITHSNLAEQIHSDSGIEPAPGFGTDPLAAMALAYHVIGDFGQALHCAEEARRRDEKHGDKLNLMVATYVLCMVELAMGKLDSARSSGLHSLSLAEQYGHSWFQAYILMELGNIAVAQEEPDRAREHYQNSYALKEAIVDPEGMAAAMNKLGQVALLDGDYREAEQQHRRSMKLYEHLSDPGGLAITLHGLANVAAAEGDIGSATDAYVRALEIMLTIGFWPRAVLVLVDVAEMLVNVQHDEQGAVQLYRVVQDHPSADASTRRRAHDLLDDLSAGSTDVSVPETDDAVDVDLPDLIADVLAALEEIKTAVPCSDPPDDPVVAANQQLIEPLTGRELEVLQHLSAGLTNPQIAEELIISVGTVKSYTGQIYGKLAVRNRTQAVNRARELGLLS